MSKMLLSEVRAIAAAAGALVLSHYGSASPADRKADDSPVTAADRAANEAICDALARLTPDIPSVSEEAAENHATAAPPVFWLVDPLDGTKEFLKQTGEFTVNIALVRDGTPVLGVVHVPARGITYFAATGEGAFRSAGSGEPERIATTPASADALRIVASRDHAGPLVTRMLERLPSARTLSMGSSLKFCLVAEGRADVYLRDIPTMEWDTAAAHCIVAAAGGQVLRFPELQPLRYGKAEYRNPSIVTIGDDTLTWLEFLT